MTTPQIVTVELGPEWDSELLAKLRTVVEASGGEMAETSWGVGGSQEVCEYQIDMPNGQLSAVSETYMGLSLRGPSNLVNEVATSLKKMRSA